MYRYYDNCTLCSAGGIGLTKGLRFLKFYVNRDLREAELTPSTSVTPHRLYLLSYNVSKETAVAQWLRCCATNRKAAGSIPAGVSGFFIHIKSFRSHYGPGIDTASNRNE